MKKDILLVVETVSNEKDVDKELIFEAIETALAMATKKKAGEDIDVLIRIDRRTGEYETFRCWKVVDDEMNEADEKDEMEQQMISPPFDVLKQIYLSEAKQRNPNSQVGDVIEDHIPSVAFGRIEVQIAKQVIIRKVREAERSKIVVAYTKRIGELFLGIVRRVMRDGIVVDLVGGDKGIEAFIPREEVIPGEEIRVKDRLRAYLYAVNPQARGPQLLMSRTSPKMLFELFRTEVPEIAEGVVEIKGVARDPGARAKIAVKAKDGRVDPIGACVGMRGTRVQAVSTELAGERIDIVQWVDDPVQFVINAMAPAEVASIVVDEDGKAMDVAVQQESQLSQAIGRNGQNVRLASELTGWNISVLTLKEEEEKLVKESENLQKIFMEQLRVDEPLAHALVQEGEFTSLEEIAYVSKEELLGIGEFDEEFVEDLQNRAKQVLSAQILRENQDSEQKESSEPDQNLLSVAGVTEEISNILVKKGISSRKALADLAVDELLDLIDLDPKKAGELIMAARCLAHWSLEKNG